GLAARREAQVPPRGDAALAPAEADDRADGPRAGDAELQPRALAEPDRGELAGELERAAALGLDLQLGRLAALPGAADGHHGAALHAVEAQPGDPRLPAAVIPGVADHHADRRVGLRPA